MSNSLRPLLLDIHIPYCVRPERYQNRAFAVGSNAEKNAYMAALKREVLSWQAELDGYEIEAVRLSGGSATVMSPDLLGELLASVRKVLPVKAGAEVSVDAHPLTIGTPALTGIAAGQPTRMELMMRSDSDEELQTLGCAYTKQHVRNAVLFFQKFHLNNLGLTVNYGIPGQTEVSWLNTLHACAILRPAHITLEPLSVSGEEEQFALYDRGCEYLEAEGYRQYSARHFCLPHRGYLYELLRLEGTEYLGLGLGARSLFDGFFTRSTNNLDLYLRNAGDYEKLTAEALEADRELRMRDYAEQRLRSTEGLRPSAFAARFDAELPADLRALLDKRVALGLLRQAEDGFLPTREGLFEKARNW